MNDPARMYRESAVRYASPVGLVVILYEEIIRSIRKAHHAFQQEQVEQRCRSLSHAIEVIGYLQSVIDFEKGEDVAVSLSNFYNVARKVIVECNNRGTGDRLVSLAADFSSLAQAWQQVDRIIGNPSDIGAAEAPIPPIPLPRLQVARARPRVHR